MLDTIIVLITTIGVIITFIASLATFIHTRKNSIKDYSERKKIREESIKN